MCYNGGMSAPTGDDLRELAAAMEKLAAALREVSELAREAKKENPDWQALPTTLAELNRRLYILSSRL